MRDCENLREDIKQAFTDFVSDDKFSKWAPHCEAVHEVMGCIIEQAEEATK